MVDFTVDHRVRFEAENERVKAEIKRTIVALTGRLEEVVKRNLSGGSPYLKVDSGRLRGSVVGRVRTGRSSRGCSQCRWQPCEVSVCP